MPSFWLGDLSASRPSARATSIRRQGIVLIFPRNSSIYADKVTEMQSVTKPTRSHSPRVLILSGTSEASELATQLAARADLTVISSFAGRVSQPRLPAGIVRVGGFGGVTGLISYLVDENIEVVIDATHPFAAKISGNAELACKTLSVPLIALERPPGEPKDYDRWSAVPVVQAAASMLTRKSTLRILSIGGQQ